MLADSHIHFAWYALSLRQLDLAEATSLDHLLALVARRARETPPAKWILGLRWN